MNEVRTDANGRYSVTWQKQNFGGGVTPYIVARDVERNLAASHDIDDTTTNLDLSLQPALTLSVKVQDVNGKPIPAAAENLTLWAGTMGQGISQMPATADDQGVIEVKALPQGRHYSAAITARGYGSTNLQAQIAETKTTRFDFPAVVLQTADRKLAGQVLGPDSKPVSGANVNMQGEGQPYATATADAAGRFAFAGACQGAVQLSASGRLAGGNYMSGSAHAEGGDTNVVIRFGIFGGSGAAGAPVVTTAGKVLDPAGAPVAGARLSILGASGGNIEVRSEADGRYSITWQMQNYGGGQISPILYVRDMQRHLAVSHDLDETTTNLDLKLQPGLTLSVKVRDEKGKPIPAVAAGLWIRSGNSSFGFDQTAAQADEQGLIEIKDLPQELHYSVNLMAKGYGTASREAEIADTKTTRLEFPAVVLKVADRKLAGQVLGVDGKPIAGASVSVHGEGQPNNSTNSDARGRFAFDGVSDGPAQLNVSYTGSPGGFGRSSMYTSAQARGGDTNVVIRFAVNGSGGAANAKFMTTSGTVLDPSGAPVSGAQLSVLPGSGMNLELKSDTEGKYSITWQQQNNGGRRQTFILARDRERHLTAHHELADTTTNLDLRLQPALTLAVKVQDAKGKPIAAATETLFARSENSTFSFNQSDGKANEQGVIEIKDLPPEWGYSVAITAKGYGTANLQIQAGEAKTSRFEFPAVVLRVADRKLAGQVLGPDGKPVARANVSVQGEGQPYGGTTTDAQGRFAFDGVCEGTVQVSANGQGGVGGNYLNGSVQAIGGDTNVVIRFAANGNAGAPNAKLVTTSGTVLDPVGAPVSGARLRIVSSYGPGIEVTSEVDGKYSITWQQQDNGNGSLPFIYARDAEQDLAASHDVEGTTTNLDLRLQPALTLSAKVQDAKGKPIAAAADVLLAYSGNAGFAISQGSASANAQGVIEFKGLPQGRRYSATITARGYGTANLEAQIAQTQTNHFNFPTTVLKAADRKLAGQVLGLDGKPVARANVNMQGDGQPLGNTTTDAQGRFVFDAACQGPVRLYANSRVAGGASLNGSIQAQGGDTNVVIRFGIYNQGGAANAQVVTTTGRVLDSSGAPVPGARLSVFLGSGMNAEVRSDADGKYSITWQVPIPGARAGAAAGRRGGVAAPAFQDLLIGRDTEHNLASAVALDEQATNVDLHLETALTISGSVQDPAGAPVKNARISLILFSGNRAGSIGQPQPPTVDAQGAFSISNLPQSQRYTLSVTAAGYGSASRQLAATETERASLQLPPFILKVADQKLAGQVVDTDDKPVSGVQVLIGGAGQPGASTTTDSQGHFAFSQVCEGTLRVSAIKMPPGFTGGALPAGSSGNVAARGGDLNVVVKLGASPTAAGSVIRQAPPRTSPPKAQPWTWAALLRWPQEHKTADMVLLCLQMTASVGAAGVVFWLLRKKGD
jgi:carbon monoxide dehydrogenase subunit G